jgi:hypothetical protein
LQFDPTGPKNGQNLGRHTDAIFKIDDLTSERKKRWRVGRFHLEIQERIYPLAELLVEISVCGKGFLFTAQDVQVTGVEWVKALENLTRSALEHKRRRYSSLPPPGVGLLTRANKLVPYDSCPERRCFPGRPRAPGLSDVLGNNQKNHTDA